MKSCKDCKDRAICKKPCEWLEAQLKRVEVDQEFPTMTEAGIDQRQIK